MVKAITLNLPASTPMVFAVCSPNVSTLNFHDTRYSAMLPATRNVPIIGTALHFTFSRLPISHRYAACSDPSSAPMNTRVVIDPKNSDIATPMRISVTGDISTRRDSIRTTTTGIMPKMNELTVTP